MAPRNPDEFDGYRKWLGIANKKRPPTHYELLAISLDEDDPEVIRAAAEQRRHYVETKRGEGHDSVVNEILYRIGEAEATLLNDEMRRDYDRQLNLFEKRRKNRQVDPFASPSRIRSQPGRTVGEDSGIVKTFVGIMAVVCVGFGGMAWLSFGLPWSKPAKQPEAIPVVQNVIVPQSVPQPVEQPAQAAPTVPEIQPETATDRGPDNLRDANAEAMKALQGDWKCVFLQQNGGVGLTDKDDKLASQDRRIAVEDNTFSLMRTRDGQRSGHSGKFIINPSTGHFDFIGKGPAGVLNEWIGIYSVDTDTLKLCYRVKNNDKATRPSEFRTDNSDETNTMLLEEYRRDGKAETKDEKSSGESIAHWKFWDVFASGVKQDMLIVARDGMLLSPAHDMGFCLTTLKEYSEMDFRMEFQFQTGDGLANPYVGVVSTLPNPAASDWKQQIPRSIQIKLDPKVAGELVLPTSDFKVKLNEVQKIHNARHIAPINKAEVKLREWNTLEVKCTEDSKLIVKINGVTVNRLEGMQTNKGHVVIWPANAEMRLRNAVVAVDGSETKLSFEHLDDSLVAAKAPEAAESKLAFSAVMISIAKDGTGKLIVDSREPNEIQADESKGKSIKIAALGDAKVASEEDGRLRVLYDFSEFNALDQLKAPSMNPDEVTLFKQVSIDADEKALVFNPGSLGKVRLRFPRPVQGPLDINLLLKGASEGVVQLQFENGQDVLIVSLHGKNSPEKEATGTVLAAMKTGKNFAPLLRANQPIAQRKEFDFKVKPAWSQERTAILVAYQGDVPIAIPRLEVTAKMIPSFGIALAQKGKRVIAEKILDDSAGAAAGIKAGDTILKINGKASDDVAGAMKLLGESTLDKDAVFEIERFGKKQTINVTPK